MIRDSLIELVECYKPELYWQEGIVKCDHKTPFVRYIPVSENTYKKPINGSTGGQSCFYTIERFRLEFFTRVPNDCKVDEIVATHYKEAKELKDLARMILGLFFKYYGVKNKNGKTRKYEQPTGEGNGWNFTTYPSDKTGCKYLIVSATATVEYMEGCDPCRMMLFDEECMINANIKRIPGEA